MRPYRPRDHTIWTLLHDLHGSTLWVTRLRAWSGATGWRFESSSAHEKALHSGAFALSRRVSDSATSAWQLLWQLRSRRMKPWATPPARRHSSTAGVWQAFAQTSALRLERATPTSRTTRSCHKAVA